MLSQNGYTYVIKTMPDDSPGTPVYDAKDLDQILIESPPTGI